MGYSVERAALKTKRAKGMKINRQLRGHSPRGTGVDEVCCGSYTEILIKGYHIPSKRGKRTQYWGLDADFLS